jgi:hypothetical protein
MESCFIAQALPELLASNDPAVMWQGLQAHITAWLGSFFETWNFLFFLFRSNEVRIQDFTLHLLSF